MSATFTLPPHVTARFIARSQSRRQAASPISRPSTSLSKSQGDIAHDILSYSIASTSTYGSILVASSSKGISAVLLQGTAKDERSLEQNLKRRFPRCQIRRNVGDVDDTQIRLICDYLDGEGNIDMQQLTEINLDLRGTAFQKKIWNALRDIPMGETESYQQLTQRAGLSASSVRAVANAVGSNHVAILVPCHRVIRSDGGLGGYHWGVDIKVALLSREDEIKHKES